MVQFLRILALAASLPLLLPAGLCVCKAVGRCTNPTASVAPEPGCCGHDHDDHDEPEHPAEPGPHDDHAPGCPATITNLERPSLAGPAPGELGLVASPVVVSFTPPVAPRVHRPLDLRPAAPPLYLSHCSLQI